MVARPEVAERVRHLLAPEAELADASELDANPKLVLSAARAGKLVVRLYRGDALAFSGAAEEAAACAKAGIRFEIVPGLPAATAVPAYAGIPLTTESRADVRIIHAAELSRAPAGPGTLVILGAESGPADIGKMLVAAGWPQDTPFAVTWNGTTTAQQTVVTTLGSVAADLKAAGISMLTTHGPAVAVAGEAVAARDGLSWFETKPLFGWRVLVPRTKEQAADVSLRLRAYGAVPEEVPTIAVEPPRTPQQMDRAVKGLVTGRYQWIAFTSVNAVRAIREKFEEYGLDARAFAGVKVAAVGEQTAAALRAFGIMPELVPDGEQSGEGLAAAWPPYDDVLDPINRVLLPRADIATETLVARLTELGWEAEDVTAYRTVRASPPPAPIREAIKTRRIRRGPVHLLVHGAEPDRHRGQAARAHRDRRDRAADREDRGRVRPAGRRAGRHALGHHAGGRPGRARRRPAQGRHRGRGAGAQAERAQARRPAAAHVTVSGWGEATR